MIRWRTPDLYPIYFDRPRLYVFIALRSYNRSITNSPSPVSSGLLILHGRKSWSFMAPEVNSARVTVILQFCQWLYNLPWVVQLEESDNLFPMIESVHVLGIALMAGTLITVDLRVLGATFPQEPVRRIAGTLLPYTWAGFVLMVATGLPLFAAESINLINNPAFQVKLVLLALAGVNALLFHLTVYRRVDSWGSGGTSPPAARLLAGVSVLLWLSIIVSGRLIAVFHRH